MSYSSVSAIPAPDGWHAPGYEHVRELGSGSFGRVVLAVRAVTGERVAIKYLNRRLLTNPRFVEEFAAEARLLSMLRSPHIARIHEYVHVPEGAAIVMDLIDGVSLREILDTSGPMGPEAALAILKGSLLGLSAAHWAGVVHRDYKPGNVLVTEEGRSALVDFGVATRAGSDALPGGTPPYMAPEQWRSGPASPATDVYAATAVFFECVVGHRPYSAPTLTTLAALHLQAPIPAEQAPEELRGLIRRGLAKDPAGRPWGAAEFVAELEAVAVGAYGPDWEQRGLRALAMLAAALSGLFPLAAALGPAGAPATTGAAASGPAGTPGAEAPVAQQGAGPATPSGPSGPPGPDAAGADPSAAGSVPGRAARHGSAKTAKVVAAVAGTAVIVGAVGVYVRSASSAEPVSAARPAAVTPSGTPTPPPLADAALVGGYRLKVQRTKLKPGLSELERLAVRNLVKNTDGQVIRIAGRGGGLEMRGSSGPAQKLRRKGPYTFVGAAASGADGRLVVRPEDVVGGVTTRITIISAIVNLSRKEMGEMTVVGTRR